jgi:phosphatidylserine/phosphatidylglycerophosphate/cardiolipin synthase-like enzyme
MAKAYGPRPPWHDIQLAISGPAVGDVETVFRERWENPQALSRSPIRWLIDRARHDNPFKTLLPPQHPDPEPAGPHPVQLLRTYPRRLGGYPFAPAGERSVARGYTKAVNQARHLIYIEDQYLWSPEVAATLNRRSWTHDSELTAAVYDPGYARAMRLNLAGEHLDREGRWTICTF